VAVLLLPTYLPTTTCHRYGAFTYCGERGMKVEGVEGLPFLYRFLTERVLGGVLPVADDTTSLKAATREHFGNWDMGAKLRDVEFLDDPLVAVPSTSVDVSIQEPHAIVEGGAEGEVMLSLAFFGISSPRVIRGLVEHGVVVKSWTGCVGGCCSRSLRPFLPLVPPFLPAFRVARLLPCPFFCLFPPLFPCFLCFRCFLALLPPHAQSLCHTFDRGMHASYFDSSQTVSTNRLHALLPPGSSHIVMGPWSHGARRNCSAHSPSPGPGFDVFEDIAQFFDDVLVNRTGHEQAGGTAGSGSSNRSATPGETGGSGTVSYFVMGSEEWRVAPQWPLANRTAQRMHFAAGRQLTRHAPTAVGSER